MERVLWKTLPGSCLHSSLQRENSAKIFSRSVHCLQVSHKDSLLRIFWRQIFSDRRKGCLIFEQEGAIKKFVSLWVYSNKERKKKKSLDFWVSVSLGRAASLNVSKSGKSENERLSYGTRIIEMNAHVREAWRKEKKNAEILLFVRIWQNTNFKCACTTSLWKKSLAIPYFQLAILLLYSL